LGEKEYEKGNKRENPAERGGKRNDEEKKLKKDK
jgi:hypothetical protein